MTTRIDTRDTCKLCMRVRPNFCKRHAPRMTVRKTMLFTESQVKNYVIGILYEVERDIDSMFRVCVNNDYNKEYVGTAELYLMLQKRRRELKK